MEHPTDYLILPRKEPLFIFILALTLLLSGVLIPPIGHLHSWNQITTLANIRAIVTGEAPWYQPQDVVTRVTWDLAPEDRFTAFEEFPLYQLVSAVCARVFGFTASLDLIVPAHALSIALWALGALFFFLLTSNRIALFLYLTSFPMLYYGQATMSDIGMVALLMGSLAFLDRATGKGGMGLMACVCLTISMLFKSYSIFFTPLLFLGLRRSGCGLVKNILLCIATCIPILTWHIFTMLQSGHLEGESHLMSQKIGALLDFSFFYSLFRLYFRYLGEIAGTLSLLLWFWHRHKQRWWVHSGFYCFLVYLLFCADKLAHHDYYFLPGFLFLAAWSASILQSAVSAGSRNWVLRVTIAFLALIHIGIHGMRFRGAIAPNTDVLECAEMISKSTPSEALVATAVDVSRFNSINYFSERRGLHVEQSAFPVARYAKSGARYLAMDFSSKDLPGWERWLSENKTALTLIKELHVFDARKKPRTCRLYQITS